MNARLVSFLAAMFVAISPLAGLAEDGMGAVRSPAGAAVNLLWNPVPRVTFGLEYMYGWRYLARAAQGTQGYGEASRLQLALSYGF